MSHVTVRRAQARDVSAIALVVKESWLASIAHLLPGDTAYAVTHGDKLAEVVSINWPSIRVADVGGVIVGTVGTNEQGHIWMLYVLPSHQGLGIGSALYAAAIERLRKAGRRKAVLEVLAANENAVAFYRSKGWVPEGRRTEHIPGFRFTAVRMGLALA